MSSRWRPAFEWLPSFRSLLLPFTADPVIPTDSAMYCFVYASQRKANTYVWLRQKDGFKVIPASLAVLLGDMRFVLELDLHKTRHLPQEDVEVVMQNLETQGWHLQLAPQQILAAAPGLSEHDVGRQDE